MRDLVQRTQRPEMQTDARPKLQEVRSIPFGERPGKEPYNASEVVTLGDSRFLFCDNNVGDALFELRLAPPAFAPDAGESVASLIKDPPVGAPVPPILPPRDGYLLLDKSS